MSSQQRKKKFAQLLQGLLERQNGVKGKLAEKLKISPARLTPWLQGKVDPAGLDILTFKQVAQVQGCSVDELVHLLDFVEVEGISQTRFRELLEEMLLTQTQEELAEKLGISQTAISKWLNLDKQIDLSKISTGTLFSLSQVKRWSLAKLIKYLNLDLEAQANHASFSAIVNNDRTLCIVLEKEDVAIASNYTGNLALHLQLQPENIKIATTLSIPDSLEGFDILIIDINSPQSPCIPLLESLEFPGDLLIFADTSLPDDVRERLSQKTTEIILKPVPWSQLKDKSYFE